MSEIHIRPRQFFFFLIGFIITLFVVHQNRKRVCEGSEYMRHLFAKQFDTNKATIYAITPTYSRPVQKAELTKLSHVFMLVPNLHWIIVEDSNVTTELVHNLLKKAGLSSRSTQLNKKTPTAFKLNQKDPNWIKPRGVTQRNFALSWIRANADQNKADIVFFMDDDNVYSIDLFSEMLKIEPGRVGVWPVGLVGGLMVEKPLLSTDNSRIVGFNAAWRPERPFPIDMAGFAMSIDLLFKHPKAQFSYDVQRGFQETEMLRLVTTVEKLQPLANNCQRVLVWHTRTEQPKLTAEEMLKKQGKRSDSGMEI